MKWRVWQVRLAVTSMLLAMPLSVMTAVLTTWSHAPSTPRTFLHAALIPVLSNPLWWLGAGFTFCDPLLPRRPALTWYTITSAAALLTASITLWSKHFDLPGAFPWTAATAIVFCCLLIQSWIVAAMPETTARQPTSRPHPSPLRIIPSGHPAPLRLVRANEA
ncbi:hypothetical protein ACIP5Y_46420 [Nocardia sp. NPDC088792]|uniref:hypothetical protein n=1 Tax=Nocardia sp. NPDC088792 TaxID=3364332 RepID=UPI00380E8B80